MINFQPQHLKHLKNHIQYLGKKNKKEILLHNGIFGLKSLENGRLFPSELETIRKLINREIKGEGYLFIKVFPNCSITSKSIGSRMGNGKGNVSNWCCYIREGQVLVELNNITQNMAFKILNKIKKYLPIKTKIIFLKKYK